MAVASARDLTSKPKTNLVKPSAASSLAMLGASAGGTMRAGEPTAMCPMGTSVPGGHFVPMTADVCKTSAAGVDGAPAQRGRRPALLRSGHVDDLPECGIPELVGVGQEHFHEAALPVRSPHHGASGEAARPQRVHRVNCAAAPRERSPCSLTIAHRLPHRQRITVRSDRNSERQPA